MLITVADGSGSGIRCLLDPWIPYGMGKISGSRSEMSNPGHISESVETIFWVKIPYFNSLMGIWDPGWKKIGSGIWD
jgi:hypothetical protein